MVKYNTDKNGVILKGIDIFILVFCLNKFERKVDIKVDLFVLNIFIYVVYTKYNKSGDIYGMYIRWSICCCANNSQY